MTEARARLERAVASVEAVVSARLAAGGGSEADRDALRAENEALREATANVSARLDMAIDRLRAVLEE